MLSIIVTGGAGYIGSHTVVELLNAGLRPIIIDNFCNSELKAIDGIEAIVGEKVTLYEGDCNDTSFMDRVFASEKEISGCIHFAAYKAVNESVAEPLKYYSNNVNSLLVLLECMSEHEIQNLVFSSSCTVYGQPDVLPVTENSPKKKAESPYGNTKQICEEILEDTYAANEKLKAISLRYFNPVGAHKSSLIGELPLGTPNNLVPFLTQSVAGLREQLVVFGDDYNTPDGSCVRDYIHVVDLAKAHVTSLIHLNKLTKDSYYDTFNIGTGNGNTVLELISTFEKATGEKVNFKIGPRRSGDIEKVWADTSKAKKILNWSADFSLDQALIDAWNWQNKLNTQ